MLSFFRFVWLLTFTLDLMCQRVQMEESGIEESSRIVNGTKATEGQFPFAVSLQLYVFEMLRIPICTISLITTKTCLGAAHCIVLDHGRRFTADQLCGIVGSVIQSRNVTCHNFSAVIPHAEYDSEDIFNDIAVFVFDEEMQLQKGLVDTIPLHASLKFNIATVTGLGWGNLHKMDEEYSPKTLRFVELNVITSGECGLAYDYICIEAFGKGLCSGDSGGPIVVSCGGNYTQVGVTSLNIGECAAGVSVVTAVGAYNDWIKNNSVGQPTFVYLEE